MNTILWWLAQNGLVVACFVPVVWLLCRLLRHRPAEQHLLWLILLVKLITPPVIVFPWTLPASLRFHSEPPAQVVAPREVDETAAIPIEVFAAVEIPLTEPALPPPESAVVYSASDLVSQSFATSPANNESLTIDSSLVKDIAFVVWVMGSVMAIGFAFRRLLALRRVLRRGSPATAELDALVQKHAYRLKLKNVLVRVVSGARGPFVTCLGRPCLVWPTAMETKDSIGRSGAIIAHELAHIKRRDHYVAWLEFMANLVWWWNPVFWFIRRRLHETREMACDALALQDSAETRLTYAELLLEITAGERPRSLAAPAFGAGKMFHGSLQRRLEMVFNERVSGRISAAALMLVFALGLLAIPRWALGQPPPPAAEVPPPATPAAPAAVEPPAVPTIQETPPTITPVPVDSPPTLDPADPRAVTVVHEQVLELPDSSGLLRLQVRADGGLLLVIEQNGKIVSKHLLDLPTAQAGRVPGAGDPAIRRTRGTVTIYQEAPHQQRQIVSGRAPQAQSVDVAPGEPQTVQIRRRNRTNFELLQVECQLAEINVKKKQIEYEQAKETEKRLPGTISPSQLQLLELGIQEAELGLRKCRIQLEAEEQREAEPGERR